MDSAGAIRQRYESALLALPNVIGVGTGRDETGSEVIDIYVLREVPRHELAIPGVLEGVPVRIVPIGEVTAEGH